MTPQNKSFLILCAAAVFFVALSLMLSLDLSIKRYESVRPYNYGNLSRSRPAAAPPPDPYAVEKIDTSEWETYTSKEYGLSFKYKPGWKVLPPVKKQGFSIIQVDPGKKYYNIKIFANPKEFYIMGGLPTKNETISGAQALNVNNALFGVVANNLHYTFDVGYSINLLPEFNALVRSVTF